MNLIFQLSLLTGTFNYQFKKVSNSYELSYVGVTLNVCASINILVSLVVLGKIQRDGFDFKLYFKFFVIFLISLSRLMSSNNRKKFLGYSEYLKPKTRTAYEVYFTSAVLLFMLILERFLFPLNYFKTQNVNYVFIQLTILCSRLTYLSVTFQITLVCHNIEQELKCLTQELQRVLNACVINNNDIFALSDTFTQLANNYKHNIQVRQTIVKNLIGEFLKLMSFVKTFNKEYKYELFYLYIFYLNCCEDFMSTLFKKQSYLGLTLFLSYKLLNIILQFIYLSYRCYRVKKVYYKFEHTLINYDNLCEQHIFNLINLLLHMLNVNRITFSALDFVNIDLELFFKTMIGLLFLMITLTTETDKARL